MTTGVSQLLPRRTELVDAAFLVAAGALALVGFHSAFGGQGYLAVGLAASVVGVVLAHLGLRARQPLLVVIVLAAVLAVLLGAGIALRNTAVAGVLPTLDTVTGLGHAVIFGWKQLLTTVRPVGDAGDLLALPYLLGLTLGVLGYTLAARARPLMLPVLPVLGVAALSILFGAPTPSAAFLQGALLAGLLLAWLAVRYARVGSCQVRVAGRFGRPAMALALLVVAVSGGWALGPHVPGASAHDRVVIRVEPPFDPGQYPSPLAAFRRYVPDTPLSQSKTTLMTVTGAPAGTPLRFATMDLYDGVVWGVSNGSATRDELPGYARIGSRLPTEAAGPVDTLTVAVSQDWNQVWMPTSGQVAGLRFAGPRANELAGHVRFSLQSQSAIVPTGLENGDSYTVRYVPVSTPAVADLATAEPAGAPTLPSSVTEAFRAVAQRFAGDAKTPVQRVLAIADYLKTVGKFSNGNDKLRAEPGHGLGRLLTFTQAKQIVGDDEQYAAAMAVLAETQGVPARVVLGSVLPDSGVVTGNDVSAWVELDLVGRGWTRLPTSAFMDRTKVPAPQLNPKPAPPPPAYVAPPLQKPLTTAVSAGQADTTARDQARQKTEKQAAAALPRWVGLVVRAVGVPVLVLALCVGLVVAIKALRRRRRRTRGSPAQRVAGGWAELMDAAADRGSPAVRGGTRREQARGLPQLPLSGAAVEADAVVFGPGELTDTTARDYWQRVESTRRSLQSGLPAWQRLRVAISLRSLRPSRRFAATEVTT